MYNKNIVLNLSKLIIDNTILGVIIMSNKELIEKDWSCAMESDEYENNIDLTIKDSLIAVMDTAKGYYVNLVTHEALGNPEAFLIPVLKERFGDSIETRFIDQCGCGGYVLRVTKK